MAKHARLRYAGMIHDCQLETGRADMADLAGLICLDMILMLWSSRHESSDRVAFFTFLWRPLENSACMTGFACNIKVCSR